MKKQVQSGLSGGVELKHRNKVIRRVWILNNANQRCLAQMWLRKLADRNKDRGCRVRVIKSNTSLFNSRPKCLMDACGKKTSEDKREQNIDTNTSNSW